MASARAWMLLRVAAATRAWRSAPVATRMITTAIITTPVSMTVALCEAGDSGKDKGFLDDIMGALQRTGDSAASQAGSVINTFLDSGVGGQVSWGFVSGFCSGFAIKKISKVFAFGVGIFFIGIQSLSYAGYLHVDYNKVNSQFTNILDLNKDGKVDKEDAKVAYSKALEVLQYNMPAGTGFVTGIVLGLRTG
eukprot:m.211702 g.211702  ORF g.211702 m.211702 type:complete len:193 (+) comp18746_c0_seq1:285-863(+)